MGCCIIVSFGSGLRPAVRYAAYEPNQGHKAQRRRKQRSPETQHGKIQFPKQVHQRSRTRGPVPRAETYHFRGLGDRTWKRVWTRTGSLMCCVVRWWRDETMSHPVRVGGSNAPPKARLGRSPPSPPYTWMCLVADAHLFSSTTDLFLCGDSGQHSAVHDGILYS